MPISHPYEFWCIEEDGTLHHEFFKYSSTRNDKVREYIEKVYNIDIESCQKFGFRRNHDI